MKLWERFTLMTPHLYKKWGIRATSLTRNAESAWGSDETVLGCGPLGTLEYLVHEACHALDLGYKLRRVQYVLRGAKLENNFVAEARVLAMEWFVFRRLKLSIIQMGDIEGMAYIQGVSPELLRACIKGKHSKEIKAKANALINTLKAEEIAWVSSGRPDNNFHNVRHSLLTPPEGCI